MKNPLNTLFGRMALLSTVVLLVIQSSWFVMLAIRQPRHDADGFARGMLLVLQAANGRTASEPDVAPEWRVRTVPAGAVPGDVRLHEPTDHPLVHLARYLRAHLPPGSDIAVDDTRPPHIWVRYAGAPAWTVVPMDMPPPPRFVVETVSILVAAIILSVLVAWQMQRPLSRVALAARVFGAGGRPTPVGEQGPRELRDLINAFNDMMRRLNEADDDQAMMLAGVAHDLKAPLTRLKLRASLLPADDDRAGFLHDVDSLSNIVQQFLEFAGQSAADGALVEADAFLRAQFPAAEAAEAAEGALFELGLRAGPAFTLPGVLLDRLVTNLVDNALEHGAAPVRIDTAREGGDWVLSVRDHGPGIPEDKIAAAMKPFVRLDAARGGEGHCGLGLAIVSRLTRDRGGRCDVTNHPGGGLLVRVALPAGTPAARVGGSSGP